MNAKISYSQIITGNKVLSLFEQQQLIRLCKATIEHPERRYIQNAEKVRDKRIDNERRNALMILIALEVGLRASEITSLKIKDFSLDTDVLFISPLKGSNPRNMPLRPSRARQLKKHILKQYDADLWQQLDPEAKIFPIEYHMFHYIWRQFTPNLQKSPHSLRHSFAVNFLMSGNTERELQFALGHKHLKSTEYYMNYVFSTTAMRKKIYGKALKTEGLEGFHLF